MKYVKNIMIVLVIGLFVSSTAFAADVAGTLTVGDGSGAPEATVTLPITLEGAGVAGVAFTIDYSAAPVAFASLSQAGDLLISDPDADATDSVVASTLYYQANDDGAGTLMIAAASAEAITAGVIFNVQFTVNADATDSEYAIGIKKSTISNTSAGYNADGEEIDALVGLPDGDDFTATLNGGTLTVSGVVPGNLVGDEDPPVINIFDLLAVVDLLGVDSTSPDYNLAADVAPANDPDGTIDIFDLLGVVDLMD